jgi:hypothetical protein
MKERLFLVFFLNIASIILHSEKCLGQNPLIKVWDYRFGGISTEGLYTLQQTPDGGYVLGGSSTSGISGEKSEVNRDTTGITFDYWIVRLDSAGNKLWDKTFGGSDDDLLTAMCQTSDGGYLLGGFSTSEISGDKSQPIWGSVPYSDFWIVKIDASGTKQWDKTIGGTLPDYLYSLDETQDHGFILAGNSESGISGNKTQSTWGGSDYWAVKTDSLGNVQWDKDFGGTGYEFIQAVCHISDGGVILGGGTMLGVSGNKTQPLWGAVDFWVLKLDSAGSVVWEKDFGGVDYDHLFSLQETADKGFILGGRSNSGISGDKTQSSWGFNDFWMVKTDSLGVKLWDKTLGGNDGEDDFGSILCTPDGGYLFAGTSYSPISGDKTENNLGIEQSWVVKTDSSGSKQWDKTILTTAHDETGLAIPTLDGCYVFANYTNAGAGGYKSQVQWGTSFDYWLVKFCDSTALPIASFTAPSTLCPGTCLAFNSLAQNATAWQWYFPGANPDTSSDVNPSGICYSNSGSYDVQLIVANPNGSDTLMLSNFITVYPSPPAQAITQSGDTLFAITGLTSYQWYYNGNIIAGATNYFCVAYASGDYNVVAADDNGCEVEAVIFNVVASVQAAEGSPQELIVFPNPVGEMLFVNSYSLMGAAGEISVYNVIGEIVFSTADSKLKSIDSRSFVPGIYLLEIKTDEKIFRAKFVKSSGN